MATPDPLLGLEKSKHTSVSQKHFVISGLAVIVYGLDELPSVRHTNRVKALWLLHPRLSNKDRMTPIATKIIHEWNAQLHRHHPKESDKPGLIAVAFDQRNHGSRLVDESVNEAWISGNPRHAQDMYSIYQGTASDMSQLIDFLPAYLFPTVEMTVVDHMVLGVSLGGHAAWHAVLHDKRVSTAVVVVGCCDYVRLMKQRAEKSKRKAWMETVPPGAGFIGSDDFPSSLCEVIKRTDPCGILMAALESGSVNVHDISSSIRDPSDHEIPQTAKLMRGHLAGKRILNMAGGNDKLVPYTCSEPFLDWLKRATTKQGWLKESDGFHLEDQVYEGVGHAFSSDMTVRASSFITSTLDNEETQESKI